MMESHIIDDPRFWGRMQNWANAVRFGGAAGTCGSAERRYRPPMVWDARTPKLVVDHQDAAVLEDCWRSLGLTSKMIVKWWWIRRAPSHIVGRKVGVKAWLIEVEIRKAILLMRERLDRHTWTDYKSEKFDTVN